jgi:hypothetical protein
MAVPGPGNIAGSCAILWPVARAATGRRLRAAWRPFAPSATMSAVFAHQGAVTVTVMSGMSHRPVCEDAQGRLPATWRRG